MTKLFALFVSVVLASACSLMTREDIENSGSGGQQRTVQEDVVNIQKANADTANRQQEVEYLIRDLNGRVEALTNQIEVNRLAAEKATAEQGQKVSELEHKLTVLQEDLVKAQNESANQKAQAEAAATADATASAAKAAIETKKNLYEQAEDLFAQKDWKAAILKYQKYRDQTPTGKKVLDATYKIGVCFQELGMKDEARSFYEELISKHGASLEAKKAKIRLKKL